MKASVNGSTITLEYHEPSTNSDGAMNPDGSAANDGSMLDDLDHTRIYADSAFVKDVLASSPAGGGVITTSFDSGITKGMQKNISITTTGVDSVGNESPHSAPKIVRVDMLAPASPF